jgi:F-type H+-transporting ATPase subunit epsilon
MRLRIVTPLQILVDSDVTELSAPGVAGEIGVLPQHVTFLGQLEAGSVRYVTAGKASRVVITGGYLEVIDDIATILADGAERADAINKEQAREDAVRARERLNDPAASEADISKVLADLRLAEARADAAIN